MVMMTVVLAVVVVVIITVRCPHTACLCLRLFVRVLHVQSLL